MKRKHINSGILSIALCLLPLSCSAPEKEAAPGAEENIEQDAIVEVEPSSGPMSGYYEVALNLSSTDINSVDVLDVFVANIRAFGLEAQGDSLFVTLQGAPQPGPATIQLIVDERERNFPDAFEYLAPVDSRFLKIAAFGASLTQGVQAGVPSAHGSLHSPGHLLATQAGAYMPLPLLIEDLFPALGPDALGEPPDCEVPDVAGYVAGAAIEVLSHLTDPETGEFGFHWAREDADIEPYNIAVGSSDIAHLLHGPPADDFGQQFVTHLVYDPYGGIADLVEKSQLDILSELDVDIIISTDIYGNDIVGSLLDSDVIDPALLTSAEDFQIVLAEILEILDQTGAQVFLANLPRPTLLPAAATKKKRMIEEGLGTEEEVEEFIAQIDGIAMQFNAIFAEALSHYDRIHLVDLAQKVADMEEDGLDMGNGRLTLDQFGGVLTLDGVHFTDTGYAAMTNFFIEEINEKLNSQIPLIDLAEVFEVDPFAPHALQAAGFDPELCD